jgi:hypothetical protein
MGATPLRTHGVGVPVVGLGTGQTFDVGGGAARDVVAMRPLGGGSLVRRFDPAELLKWTLADDRVHVAIPATSSASHAKANTRAGEPPWPSERDRDALPARARG